MVKLILTLESEAWPDSRAAQRDIKHRQEHDILGLSGSSKWHLIAETRQILPIQMQMQLLERGRKHLVLF